MAEDAGSISSAIRLELSQLRNDIRSASSNIDKFGKSFDESTKKTSKNTKKNFDQIGLAAVAVAGIVANAFRGVISTFADYEQSLANVQAVSGATESEFIALKDAAEEAGATTRFSASQAADALFFLASAGFEATDSVEALDGVLLLAQATNEDLAKSADSVTATLSQFGLEAGDAARVSNVFAAANANSQATLTKLQTSLRQVGPVAGALGVSLEETTASLQALFNAGFQGEQAGTALRSILLELADAGSTTSKELEALGVDLNDINPEIVGLTGAVDTLSKSGVDLGEVFGKETTAQILVLAETGGDALRQLESDVTGTDAALEAANIQTNTLSGSFDEFGSALESATNAGIETITPFLRGLIGGISDLLRGFRELPSGVKALITTLTGLGAAFGVVAAGAKFLGVSIITALGPVGLAITGIAAGAVAIGTAFSAAQEEASQATKRLIADNQAAIRENDNLIQKYTEAKDEIRDLLGVTDDYNTAQKLSSDQIADLIREYPELATKIDLTTASVEDAITAESELAKIRAEESLRALRDQKAALAIDVFTQAAATRSKIQQLQDLQSQINTTRGELESLDEGSLEREGLTTRLRILENSFTTVRTEAENAREDFASLEGQFRSLEIQEQQLQDVIDGTAAARRREVEEALRIAAEEEEIQEVRDRASQEQARANQRALEFIQSETDTRVQALEREREALLQGVNDRQLIENINRIFEGKITEIQTEAAEERRAVLERINEEKAKDEEEARQRSIDAIAKQREAALAAAQDEAEADAEVLRSKQERVRLQEKLAAGQEAQAEEQARLDEEASEAAKDAARAEEERLSAQQQLLEENIKIRRRIVLNELEGIDKVRTEQLNSLEDQVTQLERAGVSEIDIAEFVASEKERINKEYLEARKESEADAFQQQLDQAKDYVSKIGGLTTDAIGALTSLFSELIDNERERLQELADEQEEFINRQLEQRLNAIDTETQARLEQEGLLEETRIERLNREAKEAREKGETELAEEKEREARRLEILQEAEELRTEAEEAAAAEIAKVKEENIKQQAELQYQADLARWGSQLAGAIASGARAVIEGAAALPIPPFPYAIAAGAIAGTEIVAVSASKPKAPQLATGGIAIPDASGAGAQVVVAENNSPELILNGGQSGRPFLREFAGEIAGMMQDRPIIVQSILDGKVIAESSARQYNNGRVRLNR